MLMLMTTMLKTMLKVREDEEVKAQLIQRIDNLTADNDCLKSEMDLVRNMILYVASKGFQSKKLVFKNGPN